MLLVVPNYAVVFRTKKRSRRYPATTITDADYADDIAILANTPDQAETDGEARVMLGLWGMLSAPSLQSIIAHLWLGLVTTDRVLFIGQLELKCVLMLI